MLSRLGRVAGGATSGKSAGRCLTMGSIFTGGVVLVARKTVSRRCSIQLNVALVLAIVLWRRSLFGSDIVSDGGQSENETPGECTRALHPVYSAAVYWRTPLMQRKDPALGDVRARSKRAARSSYAAAGAQPQQARLLARPGFSSCKHAGSIKQHAVASRAYA